MTDMFNALDKARERDLLREHALRYLLGLIEGGYVDRIIPGEIREVIEALATRDTTHESGKRLKQATLHRSTWDWES